MTSGTTTSRSLGATAARLPSSQKVIAGELIVRIGQILHQRDTGSEQRPDDDSSQNQHQNRVMAVHRSADRIHDRDRREPAGKSQQLDRQHAEREKNAEDGSHRCAR